MQKTQLLNAELQKAVKKMRLNKSQEGVLSYVVQGLDNKTIAEKLNLSIAAVKSIMTYLLNKNNVTNRVSLVLKVVELAFYNKPATANTSNTQLSNNTLPAGEMNVYY
jgi:DNA-binding NarL/FixJ family response regulator